MKGESGVSPPTLAAQVEALLIASDRPVAMSELRDLVADEAALENALADVRAFWSRRGAKLVEGRDGLRVEPRRDLVPGREGRQRRELSGAALSALASVAFRHPVSLKEMSGVRGKRVTPEILETISDLVDGRRRPGTGGAVEYRPSARLLTALGLESADDLPSQDEALALARNLPDATDA